MKKKQKKKKSHSFTLQKEVIFIIVAYFPLLAIFGLYKN